MANYNKVLLLGRLTRDPQQRFLPSGQQVVEIGIAVNRTFTVNGERREETTFVDAEAWAQQAEVIHRYLKKGSPIFVEGRLKFDTWQTKEGEKRSKLRVVVERFQFIGGADRQGQGGRGGEESLSPEDFGIEASGGGEGSGEAAAGEGSEVPF